MEDNINIQECGGIYDSVICFNNKIEIRNTLNMNNTNLLYFKVVDRANDYCCRISLNDFTILEDISDFILSKQELNEVSNLLNQYNNEGILNWDILLYETNKNRSMEKLEQIDITKPI